MDNKEQLHFGDFIPCRCKKTDRHRKGLEQENAIIVQSGTAQFVQLQTGQMPNILTLTTLTNHIEILCRRNTTGTNATAVKRVLPVLFNRR